MLVELSVEAVAGLVERERLGEPHPVLAGGERYVSPRMAGRVDEPVRRELADAGLDDRDRLAELVTALTVVQRAHREFYGWVATGDRTLATVAAAVGRAATAVTRRGDRVSVRRVDARRLVDVVLGQLPAVPRGRGESISVPAAELTPRPGVLRRPTDGRGDARRLAALLAAPRLGGAKLYAASRDERGDRTRSGEWLSVLDLAEGRWLVYATRAGGDRTVNAVPATAALLADKLTALPGPAR